MRYVGFEGCLCSQIFETADGSLDMGDKKAGAWKRGRGKEKTGTN